ncbi:hypothetical protein EHW97_10755 [Aeromicrobium camelliae]|uniref:Uncharacterized protein n=1 Tax=Aeromicrobium camelliae TaxID=1538144 RepID=A0A3N6WP77_9ACTN|nr:hypothetical protein [Aeromicrobium camelliae]RQN03153.1 hypothetical protein EHW97_10755 [Aeromicrobium camelliae]
MNQHSFAASPHGRPGDHDTESLVVDCDRCVVRSPGACADCVVSVLLGPPADDPVQIDEQERAALDALAGSGLVPPLRLVTVTPSSTPDPAGA